MDLRYKFELERKINELSSRRRVLENQLAVRTTTMHELGAVRQESLKRLCTAIEAQNAQAAARNKALREQVYSGVDRDKLYNARGGSGKSADNLKSAKEQYLKHVEASLPTWHRHQTIQLEERVRAVQLEKALSMKRQEQLRVEVLRENEAKHHLERHRQELMHALAAEQRIVLESQTNAILLEEESRAANAQVVSDIAYSTLKMKEAVYANVHQMRYETQQLGEAAELAMRYQPPPLPRVPEREPLHYLSTRSQYTAPPPPPQTLPIPAGPPPLMTHPPHPAGYGTVVPPAEGHMDASHHPGMVPALDLQAERVQELNMSVMSPTAASAYYNPRSRSSSLQHGASGGVGSTPQAQSRQMSFSQAVADASQPMSELPMAAGSMPHTARSTLSAASGAHVSTLPTAAVASPLDVHTAVRSPSSLLFDTVGEASAPVAATGGRRSHPTSPAGAAPPSMFGRDVQVSVEESRGSAKHNRSLPNSPQHHQAAVSPRSEHTHTTSEQKGLGFFASSPSKRDSVGEFSFNSEQRDDERAGAGAGATLARGNSTEEASSYRMNVSVSEGSTSSKGLDMTAIVEGLSIVQCGALVQLLAQAIERRVTQGPSPISVTSIYDTQTRHRAAHIIDAFLSGGGAEDAHLLAVLNNAADSTLGNAILAIAEGKSSYLIPSEAFTGVMTMEKLKKEYKRASPAGTLQLWERLVTHLQHLVEHSAGSLTFLSLCFTAVLTSHMPDGEDRNRLERKVSNLLQLALIPPDSPDARSPSPPYRSRPQLDSPPTKAETARSLYNPNISGISLGSPTSAAKPPLSGVHGLGPSSARVPSAAVAMSTSAGAGAGAQGVMMLDSPASTSRKNSSITALYGKASMAVRSVRGAAEFDDDEIADDDTIEAPPALKDLDVSFGTSSRPAPRGGDHQSTHSESSGSYGAQPVRARQQGGRGGSPQKRGGGGGGGGGGDDEFDF